ncbi:MAG: hypothetical protein U0V72_14210 [Cytophagales bacterium]
MKNILTKLIVLIGLCGVAFGQSVGDFRSNVATGNWNAAASWQTYNGAAWVAASSYPGQLVSGANVNVTVQNSHTITLNVSPAFSIANLTVGGGTNGTLNGNGTSYTLNVAGNLSVSATATFDLNANNVTVSGTTTVSGTLSDGNSNGTNTFNGLVTINSTGTLSTANNSAYVFAAGINNSGVFNKTGTGAVTLSSATGVTHSGTTFAMAGAVTMTVSQTITANAAMALSGNITASAGSNIVYSGTNTITLSGSGTYNSNYTTSGTVSVANSGSATISGNLNIGNSTILTVSGSNFTVTGTTTVNGSFVDNSDSGADFFTGKVTISSTGTWNTSAVISTADKLRFTGGIDNNNSNAAQILFGRARFQGANQTINSACNLTFDLIRFGETTDASRFTYTFNCNLITISGNGLYVDNMGTTVKGGLIVASPGYYIQTPSTVNGASQTQGWIVGTQRRTAALSSTGLTFDVGNANYYTPFVMSYTAATVAGTASVQVNSGDHPNISTSLLNDTKSVNDYVTYTNTFTTSNLNVTYTFATSDIDPSASTTSFLGGLYDGATWSYPTLSAANTTNIVLNGLANTTSGQLQIAEKSVAKMATQTVYGVNQWNVYAYNSQTVISDNTYMGSFNFSSINFDTRTWTPSLTDDNTLVHNLTGYQGFKMPTNNFILSFKRTQFADGYYQINLNGHDDSLNVYINGVKVASSPYTAAAQNKYWTGYLTSSDLVELRMVEKAGGNWTTFNLVAAPAIVPGTISGNQSICTGDAYVFTSISSTVAATTGCSSFSYQWQVSTDSLSFTDISGETNATYTLPASPTQTKYYRRKVTDNCLRVDYSNIVSVRVNSSAPGNETVYGNGQWIAYSYATQTFTSYKGYFTYSALNFDTRTADMIGNTSGSVSSIPTFRGCNVPVDNFSVRFRRTNIPSGYYQIDLNGHDDYERIYKNGTLIFQNNQNFNGAETNVWTGYISSTDLIDIEWVEGASGNFATFAMTLLNTAPTGVTAGTINGSQTICGGDYPLIPLNSVTAATSGCSIFPTYGTTTIYSPYQWELSYDSTNWVTVAGATSASYTVPSSPTFTLDTWYRRAATDQCGNVAYSNTVKISINNTIPGNPATYPTNKWNIYSYKDNNFSNYVGYFSVNSLSYNSTDYFTTTQSPFFATGYLGCTVPVTNYSTSAKRKGFPTNIYQISVTHDNEGKLLIDGNQVYSTTTVVSTPTVVWVGPLKSTSQIDWRLRAFTGANYTSISVVPTVPTALDGGTIDGDKIVCRGDIPSPFANLTLSSGGCYTDATKYYWQYSSDLGNTWNTIASSVGINYTPTQTIYAETWYRRVVIDVCGTTGYSNIAKVTFNNTPPGDPTVSPNGSWNAYVYDDPDWSRYIGYFSVANTLDFDTRSYYCNTCAPSVASVPLANQGQSYQGCQNVSTNVGVKIKRTGVPTAGYYQIDLPYYDDETRLYVNGTLVFSDPTWYNNVAKTNVWTGYLDGSSTIEVWYQNDYGPGGAYVKFNYLGTTKPTALVAGTIVSTYSAYCTNDLPEFTSTVDASGACYPVYTWQYSSNNSTWNDIPSSNNKNYSSTFPLSATTYYRRKATDICSNGPVYSNVVTVTPNQTPQGTPTVFGNGTWNAYTYNIYNLASPSVYVGYFTEPLLSFNTSNRYSTSNSPHTASGYLGCQADPHHYTVSFKRTNFTQDTFQIDIPYHDDGVMLVVDGNTVFSHTSCCDAHPNVWTGILKSTTQLEVRYANGAGPGSLNVSINPVTVSPSLTAGTVAGTQSICSGASVAAFTEVTAASSACYISYQWQSSTDGNTWSDISGATLNTLAPTSPTVTTQYRRKATNACDLITYSNILTITVYPGVSAGTITGAGAYCSGTNVLLSSATTPTGGDGTYAYQWQSSVDNVTYTDITGATSSSYTISAVSSNAYYRRGVVSCTGVAYSNTQYVSVGAVTSVSLDLPASYTACTGSNVVISTLGTGVAVTYQWQYYQTSSSSWINLINNSGFSGVTTKDLTINNITAGVNTLQYRCRLNGTCGSTVYTSTTTVSIGGPTLSTQPVTAVSVCQSSDTVFVVRASGSLTYQWQVSTDNGSTWSNVVASANYSGITTNTLRIVAAPSTFNNYRYRCLVTSSCGTSTSNSGTLTVVTPFTGNTITAANSGSVCTGNTNTISGALISGATYQWYQDVSGTFTAISGATAQNYTTLAISSAKIYMRKATVGVCSNNSSSVTITPTPAISITTQPVDPNVTCSGSTNMNIVANNVFSYQWQKSTTVGGSTYANITNDATYSGVTTSTLGINVGSLATNFRYRVVLSGCGGSTSYSGSAALITSSTISITTQPANTSSCTSTGTSATMSVTVSSTPSIGTANYTYKWQYNLGAATGNAFIDIPVNAYIYNYNTRILAISNPPLSYNGAQFRCIIGGTCASSSVTSNVATLSVYDAVTNNGVNTSQTICTGDQPLALIGSTPVGGDGTYTYQWQESNGGAYSNITGETGKDFQPPVMTSGNNYRRYVQSGNCSLNYSFPATITVGTPTVITSQPTNATMCLGSSATFTVVATGYNLQYQWQEDDGTGYQNITDIVNYSGNTTASLTINAPDISYNGYKYRVIVIGSCAPLNVYSSEVVLNLTQAPTITTQPSFSSSKCEGTSTSLSVAATGTTLSYVWQYKFGSGAYSNLTNSGVYSGVNTATLIIDPVTTTLNNISYRCIVYDASCPTTSSAATLTVLSKPVVTTNPVDNIVCSGTNANFTAAATGAGLTYRWQVNPAASFSNLNNTALYSGVLTTGLTITSAPISLNNYQYRLMVFGTCTPSGVPSNAANFKVQGSSEWSGKIDTDWNKAGNWCRNAVPTISDDAIIANVTNSPILSGVVGNVNNITMNVGSNLTISGTGSLNVNGDWTNNGDFTPKVNSKVSFVKSSGSQTLGGSTSKDIFYNLEKSNSSTLNITKDIEIKAGGLLDPKAGTINFNNHNIRLKSYVYATSSSLHIDSTASLGVVVATLQNTSNFTVERYNAGGYRNTRYISTPVYNVSINDIMNSNVFVAGPASGGFDVPNVSTSSFKYYIEDRSVTLAKGWIASTSKNDVLAPGRGYSLYIGGFYNRNTNTYTLNAPVTINYNGTPFTGSKSFAIQNNLTGWNLVGNPYPATIDWESTAWTSSGLDGAFYTWDPYINGYYSYNGLVGSDFRSNPSYITSGQGFFVKATAANPTLSVTENAKVVNGTKTFANFRNANPSYVRLKITDSLGNIDFVVVRTDVDKTAERSALKLSNPKINLYAKPQVSSIDSYSILGVKDSSEFYVPLFVESSVKNTSYKVEVVTVSGDINKDLSLVLKDHLTGEYVTATEGATLSLSPNTTTQRLALMRLGSSEVVTNLDDQKIVGLEVYPSILKDGEYPSVYSKYSSTKTYQICNSTGVLLKEFNSSKPTVALKEFEQYSSGIYLVKITENGKTNIYKITK